MLRELSASMINVPGCLRVSMETKVGRSMTSSRISAEAARNTVSSTRRLAGIFLREGPTINAANSNAAITARNVVPPIGSTPQLLMAPPGRSG